jgi:uncharacterized membrane protein
LPDDDEIARLRAAVDDLSARVSRLESERVPVPLKPVSKSNRAGLGLKTINRVGALTLAIGVIFFFKYAVDENLIGAASGVFVGVLLGCAFLAAGEWLIRHEERVFAQGVSGCGLAIIYISIYAAFAFYKILLESAGFAFLTGVSGVAVFLSIRYGNPAIATLGFLGALLTPILLRNAGSNPLVAFPYLLLVALTAVLIGIRQQWAILIPVIAPVAVIAAAFVFEPKHHAVFIWFALCLSVAHFAAYAFSKSTAAYIVGHCAFLLAGLRLLDLSDLQRSAVRELASLILGVYGTALLAYGLALSSAVNRLLGLVLIGTVIGKLYLLDVWVLARIYRISAFVGLGALLLAASYLYSRSDKRRTG